MSVLKCKITKLANTIWPLVQADIPVCIYGPTGIGKSAVTRFDLLPMCEKEFGPTTLHDTRLSTKDIVDGTGMPVIVTNQGMPIAALGSSEVPKELATIWTRPAFIPFDDGKMHLMFYDEFGHSNIQLQQMSYSLVLDRALGGYALPRNNRIILATNTRADGGGDNKMLKPLENRLAHVIVEVDEVGLQEKMKRWGWDGRLIAFLTLRPNLIHKVDANNPAFPTPRSLENLSKAIKHLTGDDKDTDRSIANVAHMICGEGFSREFVTFLKNLKANLPRVQDVIDNPKTAKLPTDPHYQVVVGSALSKHITRTNAKAIAIYLKRLSEVEVGSMAANDAILRDPKLHDLKELEDLIIRA